MLRSNAVRFMARMSMPSKRMDPPSFRAFGGRMPSTERASVVFPQPDSPTRPIMAPRRMLKLTPSRTRTIPASVPKLILRSRTSSSRSVLMTAPDAWIEDVAQPVPEEIEAHHDDEDREARRQGIPPGLRQELPRLRDHAAPLRRGRRRTETEEPQRCRRQDREAHADR